MRREKYTCKARQEDVNLGDKKQKTNKEMEHERDII